MRMKISHTFPEIFRYALRAGGADRDGPRYPTGYSLRRISAVVLRAATSPGKADTAMPMTSATTVSVTACQATVAWTWRRVNPIVRRTARSRRRRRAEVMSRRVMIARARHARPADRLRPVRRGLRHKPAIEANGAAGIADSAQELRRQRHVDVLLSKLSVISQVTRNGIRRPDQRAWCIHGDEDSHE